MDFMKAFLVMGEITNPDQSLADKVAYDQKIVFATMKSMIPDWQEPRDWSKLTLEQKDERLQKIKEIM